MAIERRGGDRPFLARVYVNGRRGPSRAFHTRHEAEAWEAVARSAMAKGEKPPDGQPGARRSSLTVLEASRGAIRAMLTGAMRTNAGHLYRRASVDAMEARLRLHVVPRIGGQLVTDLDRAAVVRLREEILLAASPATAAESVAALRVVLRRCVERGELEKNPAHQLPPLRVKPSDPVFLTREQAQELQAKADQHDKLGLFVAVALATGMRRGELEALRWDDIESGVVHVRRGRDRYGQDGPPKTPNAVRSIPIGPVLAARIEQQRSAGLVFGAAPKRAWEKVRPPGMRLHDLRHTAATLWLAAGMNVHEVAQLLGHADASLVLSRYGHALPSRLAGAGEAMEAYLAGGASGGAE